MLPTSHRGEAGYGIGGRLGVAAAVASAATLAVGLAMTAGAGTADAQSGPVAYMSTASVIQSVTLPLGIGYCELSMPPTCFYGAPLGDDADTVELGPITVGWGQDGPGVVYDPPWGAGAGS